MYDVKSITSKLNRDCGPTCLQMFLDYYGIEVELSTLQEECGIEVIGCTAKDLKTVGTSHGLDMKAYRMDTEELCKQDRPAIIWWKQRHFCVFCGLDENGKVFICNPDRGKYRMSKETFNSFYSGVALFNGEPSDLKEESSSEYSTIYISREEFDLLKITDEDTIYYITEKDNTISIVKGDGK